MIELERRVAIGLWLMATGVSCSVQVNAQAQGGTEVRFYSEHYGRYVSRYSNGTVTVELSDTPKNFTKRGCATGDTVCGYWEGSSTANVSDLELEGVEVQQGCCNPFGLTGSTGFGILLGCKGGGTCVSLQGRFTGFDNAKLNPNGTGINLVVSCRTRNECSDFLAALKGSSIPQKAYYAAFAQSDGFDANDGWGAATGTDLNSTIGKANTTCVARARTTCGDQGYCMLRPGLWSAWASDLKYLGGKAFACNLKTEEEARNQAQASCGQGCNVLWMGSGR